MRWYTELILEHLFKYVFLIINSPFGTKEIYPTVYPLKTLKKTTILAPEIPLLPMLVF
jgi:hypothetical protein